MYSVHNRSISILSMSFGVISVWVIFDLPYFALFPLFILPLVWLTFLTPTSTPALGYCVFMCLHTQGTECCVLGGENVTVPLLQSTFPFVSLFELPVWPVRRSCRTAIRPFTYNVNGEGSLVSSFVSILSLRLVSVTIKEQQTSLFYIGFGWELVG